MNKIFTFILITLSCCCFAKDRQLNFKLQEISAEVLSDMSMKKLKFLYSVNYKGIKVVNDELNDQIKECEKEHSFFWLGNILLKEHITTIKSSMKDDKKKKKIVNLQFYWRTRIV